MASYLFKYPFIVKSIGPTYTARKNVRDASYTLVNFFLAKENNVSCNNFFIIIWVL